MENEVPVTQAKEGREGDAESTVTSTKKEDGKQVLESALEKRPVSSAEV